MRIKPLIAMASAAAFALAVAACGENQSAESKGEEMDNQIEDTLGLEHDAGDGAMEQAGEVIDNVTGTENPDPVDAVSDATDGDSTTSH
jgi:hypothetical protein